jgi:XTP/dITP diphosphohydrolase
VSSNLRQPSPHGAPALLLASSNPGKLREYRALAGATADRFELNLLPNFGAIPAFEETAPTFAENAAGKAIHYSRLANLPGNMAPGNTKHAPVFADDSGLCVAALGGQPGVYSGRYAGPDATNAERIAKLLDEIRASGIKDRRAHFVCVIALAVRGRIIAVVSDSVHGEILDSPSGDSGFGYDPVFYFPALGKTFAELAPEQKNLYSHRGRAFRKLLHFLDSSAVL